MPSKPLKAPSSEAAHASISRDSTGSARLGSLAAYHDLSQTIIRDFYRDLNQFFFSLVAGREVDRADHLRTLQQSLKTSLSLLHACAEYNSEPLEEAFKNLINGSHATLAKSIKQCYGVAEYIFEKSINGDDYRKNPPLNVYQRFGLLERYVKQYGATGLEQFHRWLFPELYMLSIASEAGEVSELPTTAPMLWKSNKQPGETPPAFVKRVYGEWLGEGLDRAHIRNLDHPLYQALDNWLRHHEMPADVDLPTRKEQNTRWVERMEKEGIASVIPDGPASFVLREAGRLRALKHRRKHEK